MENKGLKEKKMNETDWIEGEKKKNGLGEYERREIGLRKENQMGIKYGQDEENAE